MKLFTTECGCQFEKGGWVSATCEHGREFIQGSRDGEWVLREVTKSPKIVCLCGSTRFSEAFQQANLRETLKGNIILTIGCDMKSDTDLFVYLSERKLLELKTRLDILHFRKIEISDEVFILNVGGYIGQSTANELEYARYLGKTIKFLESEKDEN